MSKYPRLISWSYYDGTGIFSRKNDKERLTKVYITDEGGEDLIEGKRLACLNTKGLMGTVQDPYFELVRKEGYTRRAMKHRDMYYKMKEDYPDLENKLSGFKVKIKDYGEYVYLDMPYLNNYVNPLIRGNEKFYNGNFVYKEFFNKEFLHELVGYRPEAMMGGVITSYRDKELPMLFSEIKLKFPELYQDFIEESEWLQGVDSKLTWEGKKAKLWSLKEGKVGVKDGLNQVDFYWNGEDLTNKKELRSGEIMEQRIIPSKEMEVIIVDDSVVNDEIQLID